MLVSLASQAFGSRTAIDAADTHASSKQSGRPRSWNAAALRLYSERYTNPSSRRHCAMDASDGVQSAPHRVVKLNESLRLEMQSSYFEVRAQRALNAAQDRHTTSSRICTVSIRTPHYWLDRQQESRDRKRPDVPCAPRWPGASSDAYRI